MKDHVVSHLSPVGLALYRIYRHSVLLRYWYKLDDALQFLEGIEMTPLLALNCSVFGVKHSSNNFPGMLLPEKTRSSWPNSPWQC